MLPLPFETSPYYEGFADKPFEEQLSLVRWYRDISLQFTDWTQVPDAPVDREAWRVYRQAMRDFPSSWDGTIPVPFPARPEV